MRESTMYRVRWGPGSPFAVVLGSRLRQARKRSHLTQAELGGPLSGAFVSAVERGTIVPSVPSLALLVDRLGLSLEAFFRDVEASCANCGRRRGIAN